MHAPLLSRCLTTSASLGLPCGFEKTRLLLPSFKDVFRILVLVPTLFFEETPDDRKHFSDG